MNNLQKIAISLLVAAWTVGMSGAAIRPEHGVYFATHFGNWYENAPEAEVVEYVRELAYWGCADVSAWFDMHDYKGIDDPRAERRLKRIKAIFGAAQRAGMGRDLLFLVNESFAESPKELRADWKGGANGYSADLCGHYRVELCPSKPGATEQLLAWRRQVFAAFADTPLTRVTIWPYDQGGCTCADCAPWGAKAYPDLAKKMAELVRATFPKVSVNLSTWYFGSFRADKDDEWRGFKARADEIRPWADRLYVTVRDLDRLDADPFMPYFAMNEISMHGMSPWGFFGANPQPVRLEREILAHPNAQGFRPYSEGIYEDMNKVITLALLTGRAKTADEAVGLYASRYFGKATKAEVVEAARLLEANLDHSVAPQKNAAGLVTGIGAVCKRLDSARAARANALLTQAEAKMTPAARQSWRWRILKIRAELDDAFGRGELADDNLLEELARIYCVGPNTEGAVKPYSARLAKLVAADVAKPVRPALVNGQEFWNGNAVWFMYPPSFDFQKVDGASDYIFRVTDCKGASHYLYEKEPTASLAKIWSELPSGYIGVECRACKPGPHTMKIQHRNFWKMPAYAPGSYPPAPCGYAEAAKLGFEYLLNLPHLKQFAETGKPDPSYRLNCYPTKMHAATARAMVKYAERCPERREVALKLAKAAVDYLLSVAQPASAPLAHFTPTYQGTKLAASVNAGVNMLVHPAEAASAYLAVYGVTKEAKYLTAAKDIAETYLKLQGADGTWCLKLRESDGQPTCPNRLHPVTVMDMFDSLYEVTGDARYQAAADRAFGFFERGPLKDWNWEGQFEDVAPSGKYLNLTKHPACSVAMRIVRRWPKDTARIAQARELLRFAEDQFVVWAQPWQVEKGKTVSDWGKGSLEFSDWRVVPAVVEQYFYREAVDASAAKLISTYLALYRATGNPLDLAKARTLGDSCVRIQQSDGRIQTIWNRMYGDNLQEDWMNCMVSTLQRLYELSEVRE